MGGIELVADALVVEREPNQLDELAIEFSSLLDSLDVEHVFVSGYVAILAGRARSTEGIDVLVERFDEDVADRLVEVLVAEGYWGPAMPPSVLTETLADDLPVWVAPADQVAPHLEVKFANDEFDRASLSNAIQARIGGTTLPIGPLELQVAYKLYLGSHRDVEDAVHLYELLGESLNPERLEAWCERLDVLEEHDRLRRG